MLRNPTYKGRALYNRHQFLPSTTGRKSMLTRLRPLQEWIEIPVPAIISEDLFEAAQRVSRDHSYFSPRRTGPDHWLLRRLVVCGYCGVKAFCQGSRREDRESYRMRSGGAFLPKGVDWLDASRSLRQAFVGHPEIDPAIKGLL